MGLDLDLRRLIVVGSMHRVALRKERKVVVKTTFVPSWSGYLLIALVVGPVRQLLDD